MVHLLPLFDEPQDVRSAAEVAGVMLVGDDGQPWCCGDRMDVRSGLFGPDYARCQGCGIELRNLASPHVNGGYIVDTHTDKTWMAYRLETR